MKSYFSSYRLLFRPQIALLGLVMLCPVLKVKGEDSVRNIKGVNISSRALPRTSVSGLQVQRLNAASLERLQLSQLSDAMRFLSGVTLKDYGGIGGLKTVSIRSLGASHTGVSLDGIPLNNGQNGQIDLGTISLNGIREIELITDQSPELLLAASMRLHAGRLALQSEKPIFREGQTTRGQASFRTGSFALLNPALTLYQKVGKNQLISLNTQLQSSRGDYPYLLKNGNIESWEKRKNAALFNYMIRLDWQNLLPGRHQYLLRADYFDSRRQLPGAVILYNNSNDQDLVDNEKKIVAQYRYTFADSTAILVNAKANSVYSRFSDHQFLGSQPLVEAFTQNEFFLSLAAASRNYKGFAFSLASDISRNDLTSNLPQFTYPLRYSWLNNLSLRYRYGGFCAQGNLLDMAYFDFFKQEQKTRHRLSPALHLSYERQGQWAYSARISVKENYRMPTFNELYYTNVGNTYLRPEIARQGNVGASVSHRGKEAGDYFFLSVDAFVNRVEDKIIAIPMNNLYSWSMMNIGKVRSQGAEGQLKIGIDQGLPVTFYAEAQYTLQQARNFTNPASADYKKLIPYTPIHSGSATVGVAYFVDLQYQLVCSGERYALGDNSPLTRLKPFYEHNLSLTKDFTLGNTSWKIRLDAVNLSNTNYEIVRYYPMPGRSFRLLLQCKF